MALCPKNTLFSLCIIGALAVVVQCEYVCQIMPNITMNFGVLGKAVEKRQSGGNGLKFIILYTASMQRHPLFGRFKTEIVEKALNFWSRSLSVRKPPNRKLLIQRGCVEPYIYTEPQSGRKFCKEGCKPQAKCYDHPVPDQFASRCSQSSDGKNFKEVYQDGPGFAPNEYVIFVDSENKGACASGSTLAFAGPCEMHPTTDRPIMGSINFCPQKMEVDEPGKTMLVGTAIHELAHALGFVKTSYALMRDENGNPRTPRDPKTGKPPRNDRGQFVPSESTVKLINRPWISAVGSFSKQFLAFVTPQLLAEGRKHYNCPNLDGIDIENEGGEGTVGTHFEKRVVGDEIMAGVTGVKTVASRLTLAFFKDSGWWDVDYSLAEKWDYGKGLGCSFVMESCYAYINRMKQQGKSIEPYCEEKSDVMCYHKAAFGICAVAQFTTSLPAPDQYFKGIPNQGGSSTLVDKCPMVQPMKTFFQEPLMTYCNHDLNRQHAQKGNMFGQDFGNNSVCIRHKGAWEAKMNGMVSRDARVKATCHQISCSDGLKVVVGGQAFPCQSGVARIQSKQITGEAICPPPNEVCGNKRR